MAKLESALKDSTDLINELAAYDIMTDTERLDWLDQQSDGSLWVARSSNTGRGFRLHNTGQDAQNALSPQFCSIAKSTVRAAIDAAAKLQEAMTLQECIDPRVTYEKD